MHIIWNSSFQSPDIFIVISPKLSDKIMIRSVAVYAAEKK